MKIDFFKVSIYSLLLLFVISCGDDEFSIPVLKSGLKNDCIKHSISPGIVGEEIVFAYAMALKPEEGKLLTATVEASIAGADGTYLSNKSLHTDGSGVNIGVEVGEPSVTSGKKTTVTFNKDTCAATLRYYYIIPEEARGKTVSFKFSATASNGQSVSYDMGPYDIRKMHMKLDLKATDGEKCYISIKDMAIYDAAEAAANPENIDLIYLYRKIDGITFDHALVSPSAEANYLQGVAIPSGANNKSKQIKAWDIRDQQLARLQYGMFLDDLDLEVKDFSNAPDFAINMKTESGLWVETHDGKYRAYVYINKVDNAKKEMTLSMKQLQVK